MNRPVGSHAAWALRNGISRHAFAAKLQHIPTIRHTMADVERAEREVVAAFKALHGEQHEPGAVHVREAALKLLADDTTPGRARAGEGGGAVSEDFKHCDEYIDDQTQPVALRAFLDRARSPAHGHMSPAPFPKLFATYRGKEWLGIAPGDRVRVVMASRMGDVGVTKDLTKDHGYQARLPIKSLSDFGDKP